MGGPGRSMGSCCPSSSPERWLYGMAPPALPPRPRAQALLLLHGMVGLQGPTPPPLPPEALGMPAPLQLWLGSDCPLARLLYPGLGSASSTVSAALLLVEPCCPGPLRVPCEMTSGWCSGALRLQLRKGCGLSLRGREPCGGRQAGRGLYWGLCTQRYILHC